MNPSVMIDEVPYMPSGRLLGAYVSEVRYEFVRMMRTIALVVPFMVIPVAVYILIGVLMSAETLAKTPALANVVFAGVCVFAVIGPGLFGVGTSLAMERDAGLMKLRRALPTPVGATIIAKMIGATLFACLALTPVLIAGMLVGKLSLTGAQVAALGAVAVAGSIPFSAIGLCIGAYVSGSASPALTNLLFLPMMWLSGMFIPLPPSLRTQTMFWPSFHVQQLAMHAAGIKAYAVFPVAWSIGVLVGVTVLTGGLAILRLSRKG